MKHLLLCSTLLFGLPALHAQEAVVAELFSPRRIVKTNLAGYAGLAINLNYEQKIGGKTSIGLLGGYKLPSTIKVEALGNLDASRPACARRYQTRPTQRCAARRTTPARASPVRRSIGRRCASATAATIRRAATLGCATSDVPPVLDCAQLGVDTVQFGYFDRHGGLHLDPARYSCTEAAEGRAIADVTDVVIYPIALFTGTLTSRVLGILDAPESAAGRPYCWLSHPSDPPEVGWLVRAGGNLISVPSPGSAELAVEIADDPTLFPRGCACLLDNIGCEDADQNMNCGNGIDDDLDGLIDAEDPGCGT